MFSFQFSVRVATCVEGCRQATRLAPHALTLLFHAETFSGVFSYLTVSGMAKWPRVTI
jgi:hypothetical protein